VNTLDENAKRAAAAADRALRFRRAHGDMQVRWPSALSPNDRDRELALRTVSACNRGDVGMPALITSFAHALAAYRVELTAPQSQQTGKELRAHDHD
jgi:hypothetical protein